MGQSKAKQNKTVRLLQKIDTFYVYNFIFFSNHFLLQGLVIVIVHGLLSNGTYFFFFFIDLFLLLPSSYVIITRHFTSSRQNPSQVRTNQTRLTMFFFFFVCKHRPLRVLGKEILFCGVVWCAGGGSRVRNLNSGNPRLLFRLLLFAPTHPHHSDSLPTREEKLRAFVCFFFFYLYFVFCFTQFLANLFACANLCGRHGALVVVCDVVWCDVMLLLLLSLSFLNKLPPPQLLKQKERQREREQEREREYVCVWGVCVCVSKKLEDA